MVTNILYSLKVWLSGVIVVSAFYFFILSYHREASPTGNGFDESTGIVYFIIIAIGLLTLFITWFGFMIVIMLVTRFAQDLTIARWIICITGILINVVIFIIEKHFRDIFRDRDDFIYLMLANCICISVGSWFYRLKLITAEVEI
ncbi:MAG: hypothetical protein JWQ54_3165 [Mucilaginibacter sp.]|nr:hypothetical protein [Mucilaginibacter sp.]